MTLCRFSVQVYGMDDKRFCNSDSGRNINYLIENGKSPSMYDLPPFSWTDIIELIFENEFGILPDSFILI